ncbi:hypothetical protein LEP1GSC123_3030 [Leptospira borgpetersenii str. 200701203]|uniref:Uncharacterized protein n=1 Tax=Leptospira borgpetersenii str. 200701203 TaxID=1193007 RepID=M3HMT0_LEPBO|nr:hypothetical protein LEP1GSC123_3030 [Leptospira borgpetersenii str. 200701203]
MTNFRSILKSVLGNTDQKLNVIFKAETNFFVWSSYHELVPKTFQQSL